MARLTTHPDQVTVRYRGIPYTLDLVRCRRALVARQVEGEVDTMASLARAVGISRSTASRYFSGRITSLRVTLKVLKVLRLTFEDVARPVLEVSAPQQRGEDAREGATSPEVAA
jgi:transcriptional regulator with XRE-family HTH domain